MESSESNRWARREPDQPCRACGAPHEEERRTVVEIPEERLAVVCAVCGALRGTPRRVPRFCFGEGI